MFVTQEHKTYFASSRLRLPPGMEEVKSKLLSAI